MASNGVLRTHLRNATARILHGARARHMHASAARVHTCSMASSTRTSSAHTSVSGLATSRRQPQVVYTYLANIKRTCWRRQVNLCMLLDAHHMSINLLRQPETRTLVSIRECSGVLEKVVNASSARFCQTQEIAAVQ